MKLSGMVLDYGSRTYLRLHIINRGRFAATVTEVGLQAMPRRRRPKGRFTQYWASTDAEGGLPLRLEGQADFEFEMPIGDDKDLRRELNGHSEWQVFPWARVGGRTLYGKRVADDRIDIRDRLNRQLPANSLIEIPPP